MSAKRTTVEQATATPARVTIAGRELEVAPLPFSKAMPWNARAARMKAKHATIFNPASYGEDGAPTSEDVTISLYEALPEMQGLLFDYMSLPDKQREEIDAAMGLDPMASMRELIEAFGAIGDLANPTAGATAKATNPTPPESN